MPSFYGAVDLVKNELRNAVVQNLGSAPSSPVQGQIYFDSTAHVLYWYNGTVWVSAAGAAISSTVTTAAIGDAPVPGSSTQASAGDHKHGMPAFAATVTSETGYGLASNVGTALTLPHGDHTHGTPSLASSTTGNNSPGTLSQGGTGTTPSRSDHVHGWAAATGALDMGGQKVINLLDPTLTQDAATKNYVDNAIAGLSWKVPARAASTANLTLSATQTVDGVALNVGDRVLVKNQTTASANGIYVVAAGAWTRSTDADAGSELLNAAIYIEEGTTQADSAWVQTANAPITVGTTNLTFVQFGGGGTYGAGNGLTLTGSIFAVGAGTGIIVSPGVTAVDTTVIATVASLAGMAKKYAGNLAGTASPETVTHNLNTRDVTVRVVNGASPYNAVEVDWQATTVNTVTVNYNPALGAGYRVVVFG